MSINTPVLDDRQFQDLVDELKRRIPRYCPEWTDHNVSDPGVTLIELFSAMTEQLLYRMNQMPRLHYIRLLNLLGIGLEPPRAAQTDITFWLTEALPNNEVIPAGTAVSTVQTEDHPPVIFATDAPFEIRKPQLDVVLTAHLDDENCIAGIKSHDELLPHDESSSSVPVFSTEPDEGYMLLFGFDSDLSHHLIRIQFDVQPNAADGLDPRKPPWRWEVAAGQKADGEQPDQAKKTLAWAPCALETDETKGMNRSSYIELHLPTMKIGNLNGHTKYWLRVLVHGQTKESRYNASPLVHRIVSVGSVGCTVPASHAELIGERPAQNGERLGQNGDEPREYGEFLGYSDGTPGQRFVLEQPPILPRTPDEHLAVETEEGALQAWEEVNDFANSGPADRHYTLDSTTGELRFGPEVRQPDGTLRQYGSCAPAGTRLLFRCYRHGGGVRGNVDAGALNTLKTSIPYVKRVANRQRATGGRDAQSVEEALVTTPQRLRARERAVTADDFEYLARRDFGNVFGRVAFLRAPMVIQDETDTENTSPSSQRNNALPGVDSTIRLRVAPYVSDPAGRIHPEALEPRLEAERHALQANIERLTSYFRERTLIGTRIEIQPVRYHWVSSHVVIQAVRGAPLSDLEEKILRRLYRFLNPLTGGVDGAGWPLGQMLQKWDIFQCLMQHGEEGFADGLDTALFRVRHIDLWIPTQKSAAENANRENAADASNQPDAGAQADGAQAKETAIQPDEEYVHEVEVVRDGVIASRHHWVRFV